MPKEVWLALLAAATSLLVALVGKYSVVPGILSVSRFGPSAGAAETS